MGLDPIVRLHLTEWSTNSCGPTWRTWLDVNLADEFRHSAANADYLPEDGHRRAVEVPARRCTRGGMVRPPLARRARGWRFRGPPSR